MIKLYYTIIFVALCFSVFSQENYFQQEVNYKIDVTLNDRTNELSAFEKIEYINNSKDTLHFFYFHLWPNAYKNNETALAKQLLSQGNTIMYYAKDEDLGYIDSLNFTCQGSVLKWEFEKTNIDICKIFLSKPLLPKDTVTIETPFHVKLPSAKISRLGHVGQAYAITQWYPKPAVYDRHGWHPMPYLNQGEFYSEFGSFDVKITLPKNYVLAATGDRIDAEEEENWLLNKVEETKKMIAEKRYSSDLSFPPSSEIFKTIQFKQYRVHDFAWFADKRFHVLKGETKLPMLGNYVNTWAFFTNNEPELWSKSIEYLNDATSFYSMLNGDYPYNHVTAVDGTISAGGGMEYPNITIIGESGNDFTLETTIMHEVGHNWFYGILGSNEREFPFLDEGLNSFYEMRYIRNKYPEKKLTAIIGRDSTFKFFGLNQFKHKAQYEFSYLFSARKNLDQPIATLAEDFTEYNYGAIVYSKSALVFDYLMNYLGKEKFDEAMRFYFENWKFKHPYPTDLIKTLQYYLNADLRWFVDGALVSSNKMDYKILSHKELEDHSHAVLVKNKRRVLGPVSLSGIKNGKVIGTVWYNGFKGKRVFEFPPSEIDEFRIDYDEFIPEINRKNNNYKTKGLFKKAEPFQLNFIGKLDNPRYNQLNFLPIAGYNVYNKFMLGAAFYNYTFLQKKFEFTIAPMYAFGSKTPTGFINFDRNFIPYKSNSIQQITWSGNVKSFSDNIFNPENINNTYLTNYSKVNLNYYKLSTGLDVELKKQNPLSKITQHIGYKTNYIITQGASYTIDTGANKIEKNQITNWVNQLHYTIHNKRTINPFSAHFNLQHNDVFAKISSTFNYSVSFKNKNSMDFRIFAGAFISKNLFSNGAYRFRMSGFNGYHDYLYDYNYIGRNESSGIGFAQFVENDGAFKVWTPLGQSSKWLVAVNIKSPKVGKLPFKLFFDIGTSEFNESLYNDKFLYDFGLNISLWKNICDIYIPFTYSNDIKKALELNNKSFFDTIRFTLNLHNINPKNIIANNFF